MSAYRKEVIGDATLYLGDCLELLSELERCSALVTDPPYGIALNFHHGRGAGVARDQRIEGDACQSTGQAIVDWASARGMAIVVFASPWKPWRGSWDSLVVWDKGGAMGAGGDTRRSTKRTWELVQAQNNPPRSSRPDSVWREYVTPALLADHPCTKPVPLMERLVAHFTDGICLDAFMGSGSTGVACVRLGRAFVGVEKDMRYFDLACRRIEAAQRQARLFEHVDSPSPTMPLFDEAVHV